MQLISETTQEHNIPSTAYIDSNLPHKPFVIPVHRFSSPVSIPDFDISKDLIETSITLQSLRLIEELENIYIFYNPKEIRNFLLNNSYLVEILYEAYSHICRIFGWIPIYLELHRDPEEGWDELFVVIKSPYSPEEAIRLENKLVEEWFLKRIKDTRGKLNITEEPL